MAKETETKARSDNKEYMFDMGRIKELMDEYGDNITTLAAYLGVSRQNLSQVFNGQHGFTYQQIVLIAKKYEMDADVFFKTFVEPFLLKLS